MKAIWNGTVIAESDDTIELEGNVYFPPDSVDEAHIRKTKMVTPCIWKGIARYYDLRVGDHVNRNAAWYYPHPIPWIRKIRNYVAFWNGVEIRP